MKNICWFCWDIIDLLTKPFVVTFIFSGKELTWYFLLYSMMLSAIFLYFFEFPSTFDVIFYDWLPDEHHISHQKHLLFVRSIFSKTSFLQTMDVTSMLRGIDKTCYVSDLNNFVLFQQFIIFQPWFTRTRIVWFNLFKLFNNWFMFPKPRFL